MGRIWYILLIAAIIILLWLWYRAEKKRRTLLNKKTKPSSSTPDKSPARPGGEITTVVEPNLEDITDAHIQVMDMSELLHFAGVLGCTFSDPENKLQNPDAETIIKMKHYVSNLFKQYRSGPVGCGNFLDFIGTSPYNFTAE